MFIISYSVAQTMNIGRIIAKCLQKGDIICLKGDLGAGKTVLAKGIACGLKIDPDDVTSPTFVLLREYQRGKIPLYHFDLYRLQDEAEIENLAYEEYFYDQGISLIEWPQRLGVLEPKEYLEIGLVINGRCSRKLSFKAKGGHYQNLAKTIHENIKH